MDRNQSEQDYTSQVSRKHRAMEPGLAGQLEYIFEHVSIGVAILDPPDWHIRYANPFVRSLLDEPWCYQDVAGHRLRDVLPGDMHQIILPSLQQVAANGAPLYLAEVPYEGFIETRGRTYWRITIERSPAFVSQDAGNAGQQNFSSLLLTLEDVTETVRADLHLKAIHHISAVIAGPAALPQVLDRILEALHELVGARRCAIMLADQPWSDGRSIDNEEALTNAADTPHTARIAAFKGIHPTSQVWTPAITDHLLLGRVGRIGRAIIITDTSTTPDIALPFVDDHGSPRRPGSVLCVPISEPYHDEQGALPSTKEAGAGIAHNNVVLGTIEVYHRRARGFPEEEVKLLERFAQQAGLAIHNARLFRSIDRWARAASRNARQKENVMQAIPDGIVICDPRWRVAEANPAARKLFGWTEAVIGLPLDRALAQSSSSFHIDAMNMPDPVGEFERRALAGQIDEFKLITAGGRSYTLNCSYTPIRDAVGDTFAFIILYHDITQEVAARERVEAQVIARTEELAQRNMALQRARAEQEQMLARLPSGVLLIAESDRSITLINERAVQLLQRLGAPLTPAENLEEAARRAIGLNGEQLLSAIQMFGPNGSPVPYEEQPLQRALNKGEANEAELHVMTSDGRTLYLLANAAPLRSSDGAVTSAVLVIHDITQMKALERAREDFFTTMAHELKTPLANIRAHLSALLARDLQWSLEEQYDFLQTADEQVERLVGMVNHFLDASRVEAGALRLEREPILLPEMLEDLQDRLEALISSSHRELKITLPPQLPAVLGDYELIMSVLINLLSNAFRYAPEGDNVYLQVETVRYPNASSQRGVCISVIDHGPGMTEVQQRELFTRFSTFAALNRPAQDRPGQPAEARRRGGGRWSPATGLGLYISRGIIEAHGSTLTVESSPGKGARFAFTLPVYGGK